GPAAGRRADPRRRPRHLAERAGAAQGEEARRRREGVARPGRDPDQTRGRAQAQRRRVTLDTTKADDIALVIEEAIVSGELEPGTVLRQEQLSEQFKVSRTPIREALRRLAALGLVSFVPNRGVRVRTISRDELHEAFMVRAELEALATEVAATKFMPEDLAELDAAERRFSGIS